MVGKYAFTTLGCKVNQYESQALREVLESLGLRPARAGETADIAVVNTCAVTAEAVRKNRHVIRKASRGGQTPVVVVGCGAAADAQQLGRLAGVAAVWGHDADVGIELGKLLDQRDTSAPFGNGPVEQRSVSASIPISDAGGENGWIKPVASATRTRVGSGSPFASEAIVSLPLPVVKT